MNELLLKDAKRYPNGKMPQFQKLYRKSQSSKGIARVYYLLRYSHSKKKNCIELPHCVKIGGGLYLGHPYCITISPDAIIGENCNIHKGVTIGRENRGKREGAPKIGNCVWIGINSTVTGNITIGDDVLIAPNTHVNCDVPPHSIVLGNPCIIKHRDNATDKYVCYRI